mmetsp:Transcript_97091/g.274582  ORF Transcript_97091/g.274582 Transcript_97091/m.274582 type:complete len:269 (+) Transcript_97091:154-960(+)
MLQRLGRSDALVGAGHQQPLQEVRGLRACEPADIKLTLEEQHVQGDARRPCVQRERVAPPPRQLVHLRREEGRCSLAGLQRRRAEARQAKVCKLQRRNVREEEVGRLHIAVQDAALFQEREGVEQLPQEVRGLALAEGRLLPFDGLLQAALGAVLEDEVHHAPLLEVLHELDDVGVPACHGLEHPYLLEYVTSCVPVDLLNSLDSPQGVRPRVGARTNLCRGARASSLLAAMPLVLDVIAGLHRLEVAHLQEAGGWPRGIDLPLLPGP